MKGMTTIIFLLSVIVSIHGSNIRIFRGEEATEGKFPYHAHITGRNTKEGMVYDAYCGGSVIHKRWILSVAHCFKGYDIKLIRVELGSILRTAGSGTFYGVEKRIIHENFKEKNYMNDISMYRVDSDIQFNDKVRLIPLADRETKIGNNEKVTFTGFGKIENLLSPDKLRTVTLKMYNHQICKKIERRVIENEICTLPEEGKGPCLGDSGGALVNEHGIQVGIDSHSYSVECATGLEIYIQVSSFRDWIDEIIRLDTEEHLKQE